MTKSRSLSALEAAQKVLQKAETPLHYQELTKRVLAARLWKSGGKTPAATINARLSVDIKKRGSASAFCRTGPGAFGLRTKHAAHPPTVTTVVRQTDNPRKPATNTRPLVLGFLERIASSAFSKFPRQITDLVHGKHGVYALYKGDHLYYVGLATNLRNRIKQHLNDKHAGKWNRFSLYLVRKVEHIRELEAMILRIADPTGNSTRGALPGAENLWSELLATVRDEQDRQIESIFDIKKKTHRRPPRSEPAPQGRQPVLAQYITT